MNDSHFSLFSVALILFFHPFWCFKGLSLQLNQSLQILPYSFCTDTLLILVYLLQCDLCVCVGQSIVMCHFVKMTYFRQMPLLFGQMFVVQEMKQGWQDGGYKDLRLFCRRSDSFNGIFICQIPERTLTHHMKNKMQNVVDLKIS